MTFKLPDTRTILLIILGIGCVILLFTLFKGRGSSINQDLVKEIIASKDTIIKENKDKIALYERLIEEKERTNDALQMKDSVLNAHYRETEVTINKLNETIHNIPLRIAKLATNNDSLRSILSTY